MTKRDLMSGICDCEDCKHERKKAEQKFKCVDCEKVKSGLYEFRGYKDKHGPLCKDCTLSYDSET